MEFQQIDEKDRNPNSKMDEDMITQFPEGQIQMTNKKNQVISQNC